MTTISATVIADSVSPQDIRLTTLQLRYPRWIHAEFMTHRVFSRNASSSRAVPVERLIADVAADPAFPIVWTKNQPGMRAKEELTGQRLIDAKDAMNEALASALESAEELMRAGAHKQLANRILEPFSHINTLVTATEWGNFFALRCHPDAEPHMEMLANAMRDAIAASSPMLLQRGEWHLPYIFPDEHALMDEMWKARDSEASDLRKISVARCARVSYLTHDQKQPNIEADLKLYEQLVCGWPIHASPAEHQATPDTLCHGWSNEKQHGNFVGWIQ